MLNKPTIIIFATGWACNRFINNCKEEYEIIALSDWDEKMHGSHIQGHEIISPYKIKEYNYDYIVIASQYVKEIKKQLFERCNIGEEKLLIPYKYQLKYGKPFSKPKTKAFARKMIIYLAALMSRNGIDAYLDYGTLLGIVRDGDIIEWDDDIDFSIRQEDVEKTVSLIKKNKKTLPYSSKLDWHAILTKDEYGNIWNISLLFSNRMEKIFNEFEIGIRVRKLVGDQSIGMSSRCYSCSAIHFDKHAKILFMGNEVKVPYNYLEYLDLVYYNWRTPKIYGFDEDYGTTRIENRDNHKITEYKEKLF